MFCMLVRVTSTVKSLVILALLLTSCHSEPSADVRLSEDVKAEVYSPQGALLTTLGLEIARTPAQRAKGLMFRGPLPDDRGMIFVFPKEAAYRFWMKNTQIPLDMIFVSRDMEVVELVENAVPFSEETRGGNADSLYVIEINGGLASAYGIKEGARVVLERSLTTND